jgi:hypothetical protein
MAEKMSDVARSLSENLQAIGDGLDSGIAKLVGQRVPFMLMCVVDGSLQYVGNTRAPEEFLPAARKFVELLDAGLPHAHVPFHEVH